MRPPSNTPVSIVNFCAIALYKSQAALSGDGFRLDKS